MLCENIANVPMIVFPRINAANARQPAWADHLNRLRSVGVERISGDDVWPLAEPRATGPRELPRSAIIDALLSWISRSLTDLCRYLLDVLPRKLRCQRSAAAVL